VQVENKFFIKFLHKIKPSFKPPTRRQLSGSILNNTYTALKLDINNIIDKQPEQMTLVTDGWSNTRGESLINYLLVTPKDAIFLKSVATGKDHHTGRYIADGLSEVIEEVGVDRIAAITTDNASNMASSWEDLRTQFPKLTCLGCASHQTNLLIGDIFKRELVETHFAKVLKLNKYWKSSGRRLGLLDDIATAISTVGNPIKVVAPQLPGKTRWQGKLYTTQSACANKVLYEHAILKEDFCLPSRPTLADRHHYNIVKEIIMDPAFWKLTV